MLDLLLLAVMGLIVWMVQADGPWGGAITFVGMLISGLIAMNFFEPLANFLSGTFTLGDEWQYRWDFIAFWAIFSAGIFIFRTLGDVLLPTYAELSPPVYQAGQWGFAILTAYLFVAILTASLHFAALPREFMGFSAESKNLFGLAPDRQWLAFTQYVSERSLSRNRGDGQPMIFDGSYFPSNPNDAPNSMQVWASFPIRYGARRDLYASQGASGATAAPNIPVVPAGGAPTPTVPLSPSSSGF